VNPAVKAVRGLVAAIAFFTRIPTGGRAYPGDLALAVPWLPVIGLSLGGLGALLAVVTEGRTPRLVAVLVVALWALLSGALHLEGLADVCDALGSSQRGQEAYRIMKDPHTGAYGVIGVVLVLLTQIEAIAALAPAQRAVALWVAPVVARVVPATGLLLFRSPPFVDSGLAVEARRASPLAVGFATTAAVVLALWLGPAAPTLIALPLGLGALGLFTLPVGGITGDMCGAAVELTATAYLVITCLVG
jgi:adenosylcobinamide-GDP ribazoletransferase